MTMEAKIYLSSQYTSWKNDLFFLCCIPGYSAMKGRTLMVSEMLLLFPNASRSFRPVLASMMSDSLDHILMCKNIICYFWEGRKEPCGELHLQLSSNPPNHPTLFFLNFMIMTHSGHLENKISWIIISAKQEVEDLISTYTFHTQMTNSPCILPPVE